MSSIRRKSPIDAIGACVLALASLCVGCQPAPPGEVPSSEVAGRSPLEVVNLRMKAYNDHDLDTFLSTYAEDVEIFVYPDSSLGKGRKRIGKLFEQAFRDAAVHVDIHYQLAKDSYVINHETVVWDDETTEYVSIYEVRGGLIRTVRFVRD